MAYQSYLDNIEKQTGTRKHKQRPPTTIRSSRLAVATNAHWREQAKNLKLGRQPL